MGILVARECRRAPSYAGETRLARAVCELERGMDRRRPAAMTTRSAENVDRGALGIMDGPGAMSLSDIPSDQIRLLTKVARMYHERGMRQPQIAEQLHISQPRVSRLLKRAVNLGIVRTTVVTPRGVHADIEEQLEERYGLSEIVVVDTDDQTDEHQVLPALGSAAA